MTQIIAHRGASAYAPENTLAAFALAVQQGADMIELDVQRSADGELVVFHDDTTARWDGRARPIAHCTLAELRALDIGGERVATLAETFDFARRSRIALNVELKRPDIVAPCVDLLHEFGLADQVLISSFYEQALVELRRVAPTLPRAYLMGTHSYQPTVRARELWPLVALRRIEASAWHPSWELPLLKLVLPSVRRAGYRVHVWTVDDPALMRRLIALGANGLITNRPDLGRRVVQGEG